MNPEHPDKTFPIVVERWRSREEILKEHLDSLSPDELRRVRPSHYWLRYGLPAWQREHARKYSPNQPRVPAGNPDGGQWTTDGRSGRSSTVDDSSETVLGRVLLADAGGHARSSEVLSDANPEPHDRNSKSTTDELPARCKRAAKCHLLLESADDRQSLLRSLASELDCCCLPLAGDATLCGLFGWPAHPSVAVLRMPS